MHCNGSLTHTSCSRIRSFLAYGAIHTPGRGAEGIAQQSPHIKRDSRSECIRWVCAFIDRWVSKRNSMNGRMDKLFLGVGHTNQQAPRNIVRKILISGPSRVRVVCLEIDRNRFSRGWCSSRPIML